MNEESQARKIFGKAASAANIENLEKVTSEGMPEMLAFFKAMARLHMEKFKACKAEGFTDAQALELCKEVFK